MFGAFFAYRERPLPDLATLRAQLVGARDLPIDMTDKRSPDPLIALEAKGVKYSRTADTPGVPRDITVTVRESGDCIELAVATAAPASRRRTGNGP